VSARHSLTRLRVAFALLALALLGPTALLVQRALAGVAAEREERHRAVAERVFDEMERALSELVAREEARPVEAWRADGAERLAALPDEPFVLGYFQVEPDGRLSTPLAPRDAAGLRAAAAWFAVREQREQREEKRDAAPPVAQAPGTTIPLADAARQGAPRAASKEEPLATGAPRPAEGAYEALQSLNRGASERAARERKLVAPAEPEQDARARAVQASDRFAERSEAEPPAAAPAPAAPAEPRRLAVDPLIGRRPDARTLLLYRSVFRSEGAVRQGLALDVAGLGEWLRARGPARVPGATLVFAEDVADAPAAAYRYRHRFAEPFDALTASLALAPLGGVAGPGPLYALSALLALTATAGLFALYRMAALAMAFAERRSNFVAAVTHELKTPVTAIRLYGEMLRDDLVPSHDKRREYYRTITAESERLGRLVDDVLELARLEKGARPMQLTAGALGPVVDEAMELLRPQAERAGFALRTAVEPGLPRVRFDRDALLQVLGNLVDNALKYARGAREPAIEVACRQEAGRVWLAVRDHGPGVASAQLPLLFEPFHRGVDERVRTTQGTGLGLALVQRLVERMGGAVEGRNAPGGGFEVRIALPAADAPR
jgi:signal transduction histidine kinase